MADAAQLQLDLDFADGDWFDVLVGFNQCWLSSYARQHPSFAVSPSLLEHNSVWMNAHFQRQRMITSPLSKQAQALVSQHQKVVLARLRSGGGRAQQGEAKNSTALVEPVAALAFAASADRCPECRIESLLQEALELLQSQALRSLALCSGFAGSVFRFLTASTEATKRILALRLLLLLATDDAAAVVHSCKIAAQGQLWQPNMFIYSLQKRHLNDEVICELATKLLVYFSDEMPISSPMNLDSSQYERDDSSQRPRSLSSNTRTQTLPALVSPASKKPVISPHRPTTTISSLYVGAPSPYSANVVLPIAHPPPSASEQARRSLIYSAPKVKAIAGDQKRRCLTPNIAVINRDDLAWINNSSPPKSPTSSRAERKTTICVSEKYSWNPDCINSVSGFEWWWRSLPPHHANLEPTQKLKLVTKAAVRMHTKGAWERAVELYLLALSMEVNKEVAFRLRVNLGCAYEVGREYIASVAEFRAALELNPDDPYALFKLGSVLKALGKFDEAEVAFKSALGAYPQAGDALQQLTEARRQQVVQKEAEIAILVNARATRSPSKPGRRLHSRGNALAASLPLISRPFSPAEPHRDLAATCSASDCPVETETKSETVDMLSCIEENSHGKKVDMGATLREIDSEGSGQVRLVALSALICALCEIDEDAFHRWLPHDAVRVASDGVVEYGALLDALAHNVREKRAPDPRDGHPWETVVDTIKLQEACFYDSVKRRQETREQEVTARQKAEVELGSGVDLMADGAQLGGSQPCLGGVGPRTGDRQSDDLGQAGKEFGSSASGHDNRSSIRLEVPARQAPEEDLDGYHSVSARIDSTGEKARQETILRAERTCVIAREHLHCRKALQEIAARARRQLAGLSTSREQQHSQAAEEITSDQPSVGARLSCRPFLPAEETSPDSDQQAQKQVHSQSKEPAPVEGHARGAVALLSGHVVGGAVDAATRAVAVGRSVERLQSLAAAMATTAEAEALQRLAQLR